MLPPNLRCFVSVLFLLKSVNSKSVCTEEEHKESARAFINCVESAKARIILTQQNATDEQLVCESLENMLDGCEKQVRKSLIFFSQFFRYFFSRYICAKRTFKKMVCKMKINCSSYVCNYATLLRLDRYT